MKASELLTAARALMWHGDAENAQNGKHVHTCLALVEASSRVADRDINGNFADTLKNKSLWRAETRAKLAVNDSLLKLSEGTVSLSFRAAYYASTGFWAVAQLSDAEIQVKRIRWVDKLIADLVEKGD